MPHYDNVNINAPMLNSLTMSRKTYKNLFADYKKMQSLAEELKQMYELLDKRHHELTYITMNMEKHFSDLYQSIYGNQFSLKRDYKGTIDNICFEKNQWLERDQAEKSLTKTFFR